MDNNPAGTGREGASVDRRRLLKRAAALSAGAPLVAAAYAPAAAQAQLPTDPDAETAFAGGVEITDTGSAASEHWFALAPRETTLLSFPVPTLRPVQSNQGISLDVMPNGTGPDNPGNGITWIDVCDSDVFAGNGAVGTARIGIFPDHVEFGSRGFSGGSGKPVWLAADGQGTSGQLVLEPGSPGTVVVGADGSAVQLPSGATVGSPSLSVTPLTARTVATPTFLTVNHSAPSSTSGSGIVGRVYANPSAAGQRLGYFLFGGDEAELNTAGISGWSAAAWTAGSSAGSYLTLETTPIGSTTRVERVRVGSDGTLRLADADASPATAPPTGTGYLFAKAGALMWMGPSGRVTTIAGA